MNANARLANAEIEYIFTMAEALGSTKTFKMTQWGTLERQATAKNDKPLGLGIKDDKKRGKFEVKLVYSRRTAKNLLEQQRKVKIIK